MLRDTLFREEQSLGMAIAYIRVSPFFLLIYAIFKFFASFLHKFPSQEKNSPSFKLFHHFLLVSSTSLLIYLFFMDSQPIPVEVVMPSSPTSFVATPFSSSSSWKRWEIRWSGGFLYRVQLIHFTLPYSLFCFPSPPFFLIYYLTTNCYCNLY